MPTYTLFLDPKPKGAPRAYVNKLTRRAVIVKDPKTRTWEANASRLLTALIPEALAEEMREGGPVILDTIFFLRRPKSRSRKKDPDGPLWHTSTPDEDNLRKALKDALRSLWKDDRQVCAGVTAKFYAGKAEQPRILLRISVGQIPNPESWLKGWGGE